MWFGWARLWQGAVQGLKGAGREGPELWAGRWVRAGEAGTETWSVRLHYSISPSMYLNSFIQPVVLFVFFWLWGLWNLSSLTRNWIQVLGSNSMDHQGTTRPVVLEGPQYTLCCTGYQGCHHFEQFLSKTLKKFQNSLSEDSSCMWTPPNQLILCLFMES